MKKKSLNIISLCFLVFLCSACATAQKLTAEKTDANAEKMLRYQLSNGGWPKQLVGGTVVNYQLAIDEALAAKIKATTAIHATIDNKATTREISALVKAYKATQNLKYLKAVEKGLAYLFEAQYENGGWPQYYPDKSSYRAEITYNDDAMINVLTIMLNIVNQNSDFDAVDKTNIEKAQKALTRGIDCILKTQILQNGKPTIWAAQYNQNTLTPAKARSFEPAALSTSESVSIVRFLMKVKAPSTAVTNAIKNAVQWLDANKIVGFKFDKLANGDKGLVADDQSVIWARFYDLKTNQPLFGDRDNTIKTNVNDISFERRNGYAWYGVWGSNLLSKDYPKWLKANNL